MNDSLLAPAPVISVIDDDASVRVAVRSLVRSLGYVVHAFASADEFLRSPRVNDTACVISDIQMPGMSGVALQSLLIAQGCRTPFIFITAFPDESNESRSGLLSEQTLRWDNIGRVHRYRLEDARLLSHRARTSIDAQPCPSGNS